MVLVYRMPVDFAYGTLSASATTLDLTLTSAEFATLPAISGGSTFIPITLFDQATRDYEVVWVSTHVAGTATVTVARAQEGSLSDDWPAGTQWICTPTSRDAGVTATLSTTLPADAHTGMRVAVTDKGGEVWAKTSTQGWLGFARANTADLGKALDGTTAAPAGSALRIKAWTGQVTTDSTGWWTTSIPGGGFTTRLLTVSVTRVTFGGYWTGSIDPDGSTKTLVRAWAGYQSSGLAVGVANTSIKYSIIAVGY
jgi:hypothetical protein